MARRLTKRWFGRVHQLHRWLGTALSVLMAMWFASGAVMTFVDYPAYTDEERLARAEPLQLTAAGESALPPALVRWLVSGGLSRGRARWLTLEGEARWLLQDEARYQAFRAEPPWEVPALDEARARALASRSHGHCQANAERIIQPDQWTVGRTHPGSYPLLRLECDDATGSALYISLRSGEVVQESTQSERIWAWFGPIPHWIYPALLRRDRELWRSVVLWLAALGCVTTLSGLLAGIHAAVVARRNQRPGRSLKRQAYLLWHQRLGLAFGTAAFTWVLSGALSLEPFHWAHAATHPADAWDVLPVPEALLQQLPAAIERCRGDLPELREVELIALGQLHVLCSDAQAHTRIVELRDPSLTPRARLSDDQLNRLAQSIGAQLTLTKEPDNYYYPTHRRPITRPYARLALPDEAHTTLYVDPTRASLIDQIDDKRRIERWLYHGLHSWDVPVLYKHSVLWRALVCAAMAMGVALAATGLLRFTRRRRSPH